MTARPLVSVVIATYNMARYLPLAVRSVLGQTYRPVEVHVVDDGSFDDTPRVLAEFAADPRVFCHRQINRGQASAKNLGVRESRGELVAFLDADDVWKPDKLEKQVALLEHRPSAGVVYSDVSCVDQDGRPLPPPERQYYAGWITDQLFIDNCVNFPTVLVRRQCFSALGGFDESLPMGIDWDLWLRFSTRYEFVFLPEATTYYRIWAGQMSRDADTRFACTLRIMHAFLDRFGDLLREETVAEAWAHTFTGQGRRLTVAGRKREALGYFASALKHRPGYPYAWKSICLMLIT